MSNEIIQGTRYKPLTLKYIKKTFKIYPVEGRVFWVNPNKYHKELTGLEAGFKKKSKDKYYWIIKINECAYKRAYIIYLFYNKKWPNNIIDHIDGNSLNDSIINLRDATNTQNAWNHHKRKKTLNLPMGVRINKGGTYSSRISVNKKQIHLGNFLNQHEAHEIYLKARTEYYGEFA